jgi:hypothetical protein
MATKPPKNGTPTMTIDTIDRQRKYVDEQLRSGKGLGVVFADAFLRGMRDIGYKNPAWALCEQVDNSFQAGATIVAVRFGYDAANKGRARPDAIAICDNGNGMIPEMISFAVRWGGTDREDDRNGFGRYGYGLPSSAISLAKRYTVYSKPADGEWHAVTVDIDALGKVAGDVAKTEALLKPRKAVPPAWLVKSKEGIDLVEAKSGTVVVLEDLDRLRGLSGWIKTETLKTKLLQHFGVIYRHWIPARQVFVDGETTQVVDPLFLMEHGRYYDETTVMAERVETRTFEVETPSGKKGTVKLRAALLPPNFQGADPKTYVEGHRLRGKTNKRHSVMRDYNGILVCRERRQIDCIAPPWTRFQVYDRNIKIEIDFDPELDEFFGITTAKQQITIGDDMWEKLKQSGKGCGDLLELLKGMRRRFKEEVAVLAAKVGNETDKETRRASALAMEESEKFKGKSRPRTTAQESEAKKNLEKAADEQAEKQGKPKEEVLEKLTEETQARRWEVEFMPIPEGPFYRPKRLGEQKRVIINTDHPFYAKIYDVGTEVRAALEVMLFVLAERELDADGDAETFYKAERQRWSERLRHALDNLVADETLINIASAMAEEIHASSDASAVRD